MQWLDSRTSYGWISIILHWTAAAIVITMYAIGTTFENLPDGEQKLGLFRLHLAIGVIAAPILLTRVLARVLYGGSRTRPQRQPFAILATAIHWALLACILTLIVSGPISEFWSGRGVDTFGGVRIPSPLKADEDLAELADSAHHAAGTAIVPIFLLHMAGVAKHILFDRDGAVLRMLRPAKD